MKTRIGLLSALLASSFSANTFANDVQAITLNENCVINVLNRTLQVRPDGALNNVVLNQSLINLKRIA